MHVTLLRELVVAYGVAVAAVLVLHRLRVPSVVGFLAAGVVLGPHGMGLVTEVGAVESLAEIGVVVLLFTIGVEMSLSRVLRMGAAMLVAGGLQIVLSAAGAAIPLGLLDGAWGRAATLGILVSASSTTLVLRTLSEHGELDAPHGRLAAGIALVQDLFVIPVMVLLPALSGAGADGAGSAGAGGALLDLARALAVVAATLFGARIVVPRVLEAVVNTRSSELFALTVILLCLGTAYGASLAGLSLALGAFLGGLVVSESPYSHQALGQLLPLRDGLAGLFFVGVGMLLDARWAAANAPMVLGAVAAIVLVKTVATAGAVAAAGYGVRTAVLAGVALAQVGEFSFVVAQQARSLDLLDDATQQLFLASAVLTMAASPFLYRAAPWVAARLERLPRLKGLGRRGLSNPEGPLPASDHVIVVGFGLGGRNVVRALEANGLGYTIVEMNPGTVRRERAKGRPVLFGDAGHPEVLQKAGIHAARVVLVAISDAAATRRIVAQAKTLEPRVHVVVRTRYVKDVGDLRALGADEVVPEELEASVEMFSRVLRRYRLPREAIDRSEREIRSDAYAVLRSAVPSWGVVEDLAREVPQVDLESHVVGPGAPADGKTIGDLQIRKRHGVTVVGVRRAGQPLPDPDASTLLLAGDVVSVLGAPGRLAEVAPLFRPPLPEPDPGVGGPAADPPAAPSRTESP